MLINGERALAYVVRIDDIQPIEGADRIELVKVGGWNVVAQKGLYNINDLAVYFEIDSWIPHSIAPFLTQDGHFPKVYNEIEGQRLKTKRLRGVTSQGLLMPLQQSSYNDMALIDWFTVSHEGNDGCPAVREGDDVTELLGIQKWEKPLPAELRGLAKGNFPGFIPKTDQERVQNLTKYLPGYVGKCFEVTEKLHGCLEESTLIRTMDGTKEIRNINVGDIVFSYNIENDTVELDEVTNILIRDDVHNWYEIEYEDGTIMKVTGNHQIYMPELRCYRKVEDLSCNDNVLMLLKK